MQSHPVSPYWNDATGTYTVTVPEGATEVVVGAAGLVPVKVSVVGVADKAPVAAVLAPPAPPEPPPASE